MGQVALVEKEIQSVNTEVFLQRFADRVLVLVTQLGKVGSLIQATLPSNKLLSPDDAQDAAQDADPAPPSTSPYRPLPLPPPSIELTPILGNAPTILSQPLHSLYAAQIATLVWDAEVGGGGLIGSSLRPVVVGLALKRTGESSEGDTRIFHGVMDLVREVVGGR